MANGPLVDAGIAVAACLLVFVGAELLIRNAVRLARDLGVSALVIGLTVVAFGTSVSELTVTVLAAARGETEIAYANVVGSNIANIGLILGIAASIRALPVVLSTVRIEIPAVMLASLLLGVVTLDGTLALPEGVLFLGILAGFTTFLFRRAKEPAEAEALAVAAPEGTGHPVRALAGLLAGLGILIAGSELLVSSAVRISEAFGVPARVIGLTVVAVGTSLPELATSVLAAIRGRTDIAVGNIVGSNLFNILGILGVASILRPIAVSPSFALDFVVMLAFTAVLLPLARSGFRVVRIEGAVLLVAYAAYLTRVLH